MDNGVIGNSIGIAAALIAATAITRFLPFILFPAGKEIPRYMEYLGKTLPYATIGLLVVYCLKDVRISGAAHGLPELMAVTAVILFHWRKGNSLLSIGAGTVLYMVLVQYVFV